MCGRFVFRLSRERFQSAARTDRWIPSRNLNGTILDGSRNYYENHNVKPTTHVPIALRNQAVDHKPSTSQGEETNPAPTHDVALRIMRWGIVPRNIKSVFELSKMPAFINARIEGVETKATFNKLIDEKKFCVVIMDGFYEWHKKEGGGKQPYYIHAKSGDPLYLAGLYETWIHPEFQEPVFSFTIMTRDSNSQMSWLHDRMPILLSESDAFHWLDGKISIWDLRKDIRENSKDIPLVFTAMAKDLSCELESAPEEKQKQKQKNMMAAFLASPSKKSAVTSESRVAHSAEILKPKREHPQEDKQVGVMDEAQQTPSSQLKKSNTLVKIPVSPSPSKKAATATALKQETKKRKDPPSSSSNEKDDQSRGDKQTRISNFFSVSNK